MERLLYKMTHNDKGEKLSQSEQTHEVVTVDGIKVGAMQPTSINKEGTTDLLEDFELNTNTMKNTGWKLQQDLPVKTMHETNVGSQLQKNILQGLLMKEKYFSYDKGKEIDGSEMLKDVHNAVSSLVNIGVEEVSKRLGIKDRKISDPEAIYDVLIEEFNRRGGNEDIVSALMRQDPLDSIPQNKRKSRQFNNVYIY